MGCNPSTRRGDQVAFYLTSSLLATASLLAPEIMGPVASATACSYLAGGASTASFIGGTKLSEPCDNSERAITHVANTIISESIVQSIMRVSTTTNMAQDTRLRCVPKLTTGQSCFEENDACNNCYKNLGTHFAVEEEIYKNAWNDNGILLPDNDTFHALLIARSQACANTCKACVFTHVSQAIQIDTIALIDSESKFRSDLQTELNSSITSQLNKNSDWLADMMSTQTDEELSTLISTVSQSISNTLNINDVVTSMNTKQNISIDTSSVTVSSINQQGALNAVYEVVLNSDILNNESTKSLLNDIINALDSTTELDAFGRIIVDSVESVLDSVYYWMLVSLVSLCTLFVFWYLRLWVKNLTSAKNANE